MSKLPFALLILCMSCSAAEEPAEPRAAEAPAPTAAPLVVFAVNEPLAWMASIVRNRAIDRLRAEQRAPTAVATLEDIPESRLAEDVSVGLDDDGLAGCLAQLRADQRRAIVLAYYYGLTHEELAAHFDAPLGTVKSWVRRGLIKLKDCLD